MRWFVFGAVMVAVGSFARADEVVFLGMDSACEILAPDVANGGEQLGTGWTGTAAPENAEFWEAAVLGLGFGSGGGDEYAEWTRTDVRALMWNARWFNGTASIYVRVPFEVDEATLGSMKRLTLNLRFEDGFVAFLNGVEVLRYNVGEYTGWDAIAGVQYPDVSARTVHGFDLSHHVDKLVAGENLLAVHGLNSTVSSGDILVAPELVGSDEAAGFERVELRVVGLERNQFSQRLDTIVVEGTEGRAYDLQVSDDLVEWAVSAPGSRFVFPGGPREMTFRVPSKRPFVRVIER